MSRASTVHEIVVADYLTVSGSARAGTGAGAGAGAARVALFRRLEHRITVGATGGQHVSAETFVPRRAC